METQAHEDAILLIGTSGREYKAARFSPRYLRGLDSELRKKRLRDFYDSIGDEIQPAERAITVAEILRNEIMDYECELAWDNNREAQLWIIWQLLKRYQPNLLIGDVRREFGEKLNEVKAAVDAASGILKLREQAAANAHERGGEDEKEPDPTNYGSKSTDDVGS